MKRYRPVWLLGIIGGIVCSAIASPVCASALWHDDFIGQDGTDLLVAGSYVAVGSVGVGDATLLSNQAHIAAGAGIAYRLGTDKHDWFCVDTKVTVGDSDYVGLGFYSECTDNLLENFSGWILDRDGLLLMCMDGAPNGQFYSVAFDPTASCLFGTYDYIQLGPDFHFPLDIDFFVGNEHVTFNAAGFTQSNTEYVGIFVGNYSGQSFSDFDHLEVWWIPEPATLLLMTLSLSLLCLRRRVHGCASVTAQAGRAK